VVPDASFKIKADAAKLKYSATLTPGDSALHPAMVDRRRTGALGMIPVTRNGVFPM
jgi:hypothetical protein